jgi:inorganic phosphate transporter, PiT family
MTAVIFLLVAALAAANGANDVSKGVATLAGAGVTRYRTAILWGAAATLAGGVLSVVTGHAMGKLFSSGIIGGHPTNAFALAALAGTFAWVLLASIARLPVSTTHALVGSLIGAGLLFAPGALHWEILFTKVALPLLLSIVAAYGISFVLSAAGQVWRGRRRPQTPTVPADTPGHDAAVAGDGATVAVVTAVQRSVAAGKRQARLAGQALAGLHWLSSGATCAARALNDTPKIAAVGAFALVPAGLTATQVTLLVAAAMTLGSLLGIRVARTLGERVVKMSHVEGFRANVVTALLVGAGAREGWPMSTTHVSTGAITGIPGTKLGRLNRRLIRDFLIAWTVTPVSGAAVAVFVYLLAR